MKKKVAKIRPRTLKALTAKSRGHRIINLREIVTNRMNERGVTVYRLAKDAGVVEQTVRNFVKNKLEIRSDILEKLLKALGLEVRPKE